MENLKLSLHAPISLARRVGTSSATQSYRSDFMRDRDRVLYSRAFRRLAGKTQVYLTGADDHLRTRLTHTLEVSQIARTIAQQLQLDCDLTEAIALGHDIGHTPFGHAGERMLHELMIENLKTESGSTVLIPKDFRGFKHNLQGVATSILAEKNYENNGLNLTNFTLWGIQAHSDSTYKNQSENDLGYYHQFSKYYNIEESNPAPAWSFEAFVVREADEIAQHHHDLEDAIRGKLITQSEITIQINKSFGLFLSEHHKQIINKMKATNDEEVYIALLAKLVVDLFVTRLIECSIKNMNALIEKEKLTDQTFGQFIMQTRPEQVSNIISYDELALGDSGEKFSYAETEFRKFISSRVLASYDIQKADSKGQYIIRKIFRALTTSPSQLPDHCVIEFMQKYEEVKNWNNIRAKEGMGVIRETFKKAVTAPLSVDAELLLRRVVCNYIASMTDKYAKNVFNEIYH